jgi:hypothetical protein
VRLWRAACTATVQDMRNIIPVLLAVLLVGSGYAASADCCGQGKTASCHDVPAQPMPCGHALVKACPDSFCEPARAAALIPAGALTQAPGQSHVVLAAPVPVWMQGLQALAIPDNPVVPDLPARLFLRNRVLLI